MRCKAEKFLQLHCGIQSNPAIGARIFYVSLAGDVKQLRLLGCSCYLPF